MIMHNKKQKYSSVIIMLLAIPVLLLSFGFSLEKKTTAENVASYFKVWGEVRFFMTDSNSSCKRIDSIALEDISTILKNPSRRKYRKIISKLEKIQLNEPSGEFSQFSRCSLEQNPDSKGLIFKNSHYPRRNLKVEDELLAVCRYWNIIRFFYPHFSTISEEWFTKLPEIIDKIISIRNLQNYHMQICRMAAITGDGHAVVSSSILQEYWGYYRVPLNVSVVNGKLIVTSIYPPLIANSKIRLGDCIHSIDQVTFKDFIAKNKHLIASSNNQVLMDKAALLFLKLKSEKPIEIKIHRSDTTIVSKIQPIHIMQINRTDGVSVFSSVSINQFPDSVAYINVGETDSNMLQESIDSILQYPKIILDFRGYPKISRELLAKYFFENPKVIVGWKYPDLNNPGEFIPAHPISLGTENPNAYKGKIALLVNSKTWSQAEFTALAFQSLTNCITVGRATSGTDGDVSVINLAGGIRVKFTGLDITYPDGTQTHSVGLHVDYVYKPKIEDWKTGKDAELEFALKIINNFNN